MLGNGKTRLGSRASWIASWIGKETIMKYLLTSAGISNDSIRNALVDLLGKPIAESSALYIPTALHANANGPALVARLIRGETNDPRLFFGSTVFPLCEVGWKSLGVLELTALPSIKKENWLPLACWLLGTSVQKNREMCQEHHEPTRYATR
jgi:hypothetical protein